MKYKGETFAFVAGLVTGIINLLGGVNLMLGMLIASALIRIPGIVGISLAFFAVTAVNFAGACACRRNRIAGGVMMLATAFLMLIMGAAELCVPLLPSDILGTFYGIPIMGWFSRGIVAMGLLTVLIELVSGTAGIVCLAGRPIPEPDVTAPQAVAGIEEQPFAQRYAAYMKRESSDVKEA